MDTLAQLDLFLQRMQGRAYRMARLATGNQEDALDLVQDAMYKLVEKYAERPEQEWGALFHTILQSRIRDWHRRNTVRRRFLGWLENGAKNGRGDDAGDNSPIDMIQLARDEHGRSPEQELQTRNGIETLLTALENLPLRQQQVFLLRAWEGLDVRETAVVMACAEGSVKSHYSRAIHSLRQQLGDHWS